MSGPKLTAWEIEENRRREEERRQALLRELAECRRALDVEVARARSHRAAGVAIESARLAEVPVDPQDAGSIENAIRATQTQVDQLRRTTNGGLAAHQRRAALDHLVAGVVAGEATSAAGINREAAARPSAHVVSAEFATRVDAILSTLDPDAIGDLDALVAFVGRSIEGSAVDERVVLEQLRERIVTVNRREQDGRRRVERARELLLRLMGVAGDDVAELRRRLDDVVHEGAELPDHMADRVDEAVERHRRIADRSYAIDMLRESLAEMGYTVGSTFATDLLRDGASLVDRAGWTAHAVEIRMTPTDNMVLSVVREGDATTVSNDVDRRRDAEIEVEFCSTVGPVLAELGERGVRTGPVRGHDAGANPVRVVPPRQAARRAAAQAQQTREANE